jgi:signal peptidase I
MTGEKIRTRKPWLAGLLQFILPGLGTLYSGMPQRALAAFFVFRLASFGSIFILLALSGLLSLALFVLAGLSLTILVIVDGVRCARVADPNYTLRPYNRWFVYALVVVCVVVVDAAFVQRFTRSRIFDSAQTPTPSMESTLLVGDHAVINKAAYLFSEPKRGDIIVFKPNPSSEITYVKRIVALPGETISIRDRVVLIDGKQLDEPYVSQSLESETAPGDSPGSTLVPPGSYFVLGDNRPNSNDSRFFGTIPRESVQGRATTIYFSMDPGTRKIRWDRIGLAPK